MTNSNQKRKTPGEITAEDLSLLDEQPTSFDYAAERLKSRHQPSSRYNIARRPAPLDNELSEQERSLRSRTERD